MNEGATTSRLARALLPIAHRALAMPAARPAEDAPRYADALDALDGFLAAPVASRYLVAVRSLRQLARLRRRTIEVERLARRAIDTELDRLDQRGLLPARAGEAGVAEQLRALPPDPRASRRLQALAALLETHREIAARVRAPERLRAKLGLENASRGARRGERRGATRTQRRA